MARANAKILVYTLVVTLVLYFLVTTYEILDMQTLSQFLTLFGLVTLIATAFVLMMPKRRK